jgi:hypothetical protein
MATPYASGAALEIVLSEGLKFQGKHNESCACDHEFNVTVQYFAKGGLYFLCVASGQAIALSSPLAVLALNYLR